MRSFLKNKKKLIFLLLFLASLTPAFLDMFIARHDFKPRIEMFKPELSRLNSVKKLLAYCDSLYYSSNGNNSFDTSSYVKVVSGVIKERFFHSSLNYSYSENWIARVCGNLFWSHMSSIVLPEDILKHSGGLCSQQTIVFMELLKEKGINMRSVGLGRKEGPGHFLCEVYYNNAWHVHDVSEEPDWDKVHNHHESMGYYVQNKDSLYKAYASRMPRDVFFTIMKTIDYGKVNETPARNMRLFHTVTWYMVYAIPALFLLLAVFPFRRKKAAEKDLQRKSSDVMEMDVRGQIHLS